MTAWYNGFAPYVPVAERRARAQRQASKLAKKGRTLNPISIAGRTIASSWWGKSWCANLERYADFAYRLERGRAYVRNGMVLDMSIEKGTVKALVAGSRATPYNVTVTVKPLSESAWKRLSKLAQGRIDTLQELLAGKFPEELRSSFFDKTSGLFPKPSEISLDCTCPDWATMCKHVAAALYGVGARVDTDPSAFFVLRGVSMDDLVSTAAAHERTRLLTKKSVKSKRLLKTKDTPANELSALFGVNVEQATDASPKKSAQRHPTSNQPHTHAEESKTRGRKKAAPKRKAASGKGRAGKTQERAGGTTTAAKSKTGAAVKRTAAKKTTSGKKPVKTARKESGGVKGRKRKES